MTADELIRSAVASSTSAPCDHAGAPPVCSGCAERVARSLADRLAEGKSGFARDLLMTWEAGGERALLQVLQETMQAVVRR